MYRYRHTMPQKQKILSEIKRRDKDDPTIVKARRQKEVYLVVKSRFYSVATEEEMEQELELSEDYISEDTHRIIQFKIRQVFL